MASAAGESFESNDTEPNAARHRLRRAKSAGASVPVEVDPGERHDEAVMAPVAEIFSSSQNPAMPPSRDQENTAFPPLEGTGFCEELGLAMQPTSRQLAAAN
jgi:hypothetical protein